MKYLLLILLIVPTIVIGQFKTAEKTHKDSTGSYIIAYNFDSDWATLPATNNAQPHYSAIISVYRIVGKKREQIGKEIHGTYVAEGCFEDVPADWVRRSKNAEKK